VLAFRFKIKLCLLLSLLQASFAQAGTDVAEAFPGTVIDAELEPLMEEFLNLSVKARIDLPLTKSVSQITIVPQEELLRNMESRGNIRAVTIMDPDQDGTIILLTEDLRSQPQELRIILFHELLHAAGYDHPKRACHWAEEGCGIMGRSPFPHVVMGRDFADDVIRSSFRPRYLARLPRLPRKP
jgi:hypothetical protein